MTPELCPLWCRAGPSSLSITVSERSGRACRSRHAVASPTMPLPIMTIRGDVIFGQSTLVYTQVNENSLYRCGRACFSLLHLPWGLKLLPSALSEIGVILQPRRRSEE